MTYDEWKARDDTPEPECVRCDVCGHPETYFGGTRVQAAAYCDCPCCHEEEPCSVCAGSGVQNSTSILRGERWDDPPVCWKCRGTGKS